MSKVYILNNHIEFSPENYQLRERHSGNLIIKLHKPVSRCLELLIERRFSVVPQRDFYPYVWGNEGSAVSVMMLYQCIGLLRKALKAFRTDDNEKIINTVPKNGFTLDPSVTVQEETESALVMPACDQVIDPNSVVPQGDIVPATPTLTRKRAISKRRVGNILLLVMGILLLSMLVYQFSIRNAAKTQAYLARFHEMGLVSECQVYANDDLLDAVSIKSLILDSGIDCKERPYIYISHFQYSPQLSLLSCDKSLKGDTAPICTVINVIRNSK
jgi:DNA-binding winged helix-turn-helix (wHTH) protein